MDYSHAPSVNLSNPITQTDTLSDAQTDRLEHFRSCMPGKVTELGDMEAAWEAFEMLQKSNMLVNLTLDDLTTFALWVYDAARLHTLNLNRDALSNKAFRRMQWLHDAFKLRVDGAVAPELWTIQMWVHCLAVHLLIISKRLDEASQSFTETFPRFRNLVMLQHVRSLEEVFLALSQQRSVEDGLAIVIKVWPCLSGLLRFHQFSPKEDINNAIEELRITLTRSLGTIEEASDLLQNLRDPSLQPSVICIFATLYGLQESAETVYRKYCDFVSRGLSIPWNGHIRFFMAFLSKGAYIFAYAMRKHIYSTLPDMRGRQELRQLVLIYPDLAALKAPGFDPLSIKAGQLARARLLNCINDGASSSQMDLFSIWEDIELSDCCIHGHQQRNHEADLYDEDLLAFARVVVKNSCAKLGDGDIPYAKQSAHVLDRIAEEMTRRAHICRGLKESHSQLPAILWHSLILKGELLTVTDMLVKDVKGQSYPDFVRAITQLFLAQLRLHDLDKAFECLARLWHVVIRHLDHTDHRYNGKMAEESTNLRQAIFTRFAAIENPIEWILSTKKTPGAQNIAAQIFFTLFGNRLDYDGAWQLFDDLQARKLPVSQEAHLYLVRMFTSGHALDFAYRVYDSFFANYPEKAQSPTLRTKNELHLGLNLSSLQGDVEHAEECFKELEARALITRGSRQRLLHAYAVLGDTGRVHELFQRFFPSERTTSWTTPNILDYREIIYAHVRAGDLNGINQWLDEMVRVNIQPDLSTYNMILLAFSKSSDLKSASAVLARMYENDVQPDKISYTTVLSIMADRKDPVSAEQLYQRAIDEGIQPDDVMTMCLMDAHVEAGSWKGVIRAFDYLQYSKNRSAGETTQLYNTLLKAYVLIGAPFDVVANVFRRFESLKLVPTIHTYTLLIQSACDSSRMDIAGQIFLDMNDLPTRGKAKSHVDAYVMTIIMAGFLRNGDKARAKMVYDDMCKRGLQPRAVTFGLIIHSYANERSEESLQMAEEFMRSLLTAEESQRAWLGSTAGGRPKALESVFGPLMSIYGRKLDITAVERQFDEMLAIGGHPTLISLTMLMDAYRRVGNLEGVQHVWSEILEVALRISQSDIFERLPSPTRPSSSSSSSPKTLDIPQHQANILCPPLSIYINALSAAGRHVEIATTWRHIKELGFAFDAHNWNHLAVALVRAGEVERAFEVVERVLVPYQKQIQYFHRGRSKAPKTPLTFLRPGDDGAEDEEREKREGEERIDGENIAERNSAGEEEEDIKNTPSSAVLTATRRAEAVTSSTQQQYRLTPFVDVDSDPAQSLHELQQMSITWQAWRTHGLTLDAMTGALRRLEAGLRVWPEGEEIPPEMDPRRMGPEEAREFHMQEKEEAGMIFERIHRSYPNAVWLVEQRKMREMENA